MLKLISIADLYQAENLTKEIKELKEDVIQLSLNKEARLRERQEHQATIEKCQDELTVLKVQRDELQETRK